ARDGRSDPDQGEDTQDQDHGATMWLVAAPRGTIPVIEIVARRSGRSFAFGGAWRRGAGPFLKLFPGAAAGGLLDRSGKSVLAARAFDHLADKVVRHAQLPPARRAGNLDRHSSPPHLARHRPSPAGGYWAIMMLFGIPCRFFIAVNSDR